MVRNQRNRQARRFRRRPVRTNNIIRRVNNIDFGVEFHPPYDQPSWASAPWWALTIVSNATAKSTTFTGKALHALIIASLNLSAFVNTAKVTPSFNIRVQTVRIWGLERQPITLEIYDNSTAGCRKLKQLNDRGSPIHYSCLGWRFGKASYAMLNTDCASDDTTIFSVGQSADNHPISVYVQLLIQLQGIPAVSHSHPVGLNHDCSTTAISNDFAML